MVSGTIYNTTKIMQMTQKWEQKKKSGNVLKKENKELSVEERQIQLFKEDLERQRESDKYNSIYSKIQSGQELSPAEEDIIRKRDPKTYMEYKSDQSERKAYEEKLNNCKTKEEVGRVHMNYLNGKLSELKSVVNNPNIPKSAKLATAQRILGDTIRTSKIYNDFTRSTKYNDLPTEEELKEENQEKMQEFEQEVDNDSEITDTIIEDELTESDIDKTSDDFPKNELKLNYHKDKIDKVEKEIIKEMVELEEEHFGEYKKSMKIDVGV